MKLANTIIPQGDKILVLPAKSEQVTASGIHIPETVGNRKKPQQGTVLAISPYLNQLWPIPVGKRPLNAGGFVTAETKVSGVQVGSVVLFTEYAGDDIKVRDEDTNEDVTLKLLPAESILGVISDQ